jgi:hypothetical protein
MSANIRKITKTPNSREFGGFWCGRRDSNPYGLSATSS